MRGTASIGPTCPVERIDSPCPDRPFEGVIAVRDSSGKEIARTSTDASGSFSVALQPGHYVVTTLVSGTFPRAATVDVDVVSGRYSEVKLRLDSGIR